VHINLLTEIGEEVVCVEMGLEVHCRIVLRIGSFESGDWFWAGWILNRRTLTLAQFENRREIYKTVRMLPSLILSGSFYDHRTRAL
jgi:hypothetical protein